jgi:hypothetical protein
MPNVPNNTLVSGLAMGIDWEDGQGGRLGTPSLPQQIIYNGPAGQQPTRNITTEEADDSPTIERAEQCTVHHTKKVSYENGKAMLGVYGRGSLVSDSAGNYYRVLSASLQKQKSGRALFTVTSESISFDVPPDEFSCNPVKLGLDILKHPRYFYALMPTNQIPGWAGAPDTNAQIAAKQCIIRAIQAYRENPFIPTSANINGMVGLLHDNTMMNLVSGKFPYAINNPNYNPACPATPAPAIGTLFAGSLPYPPASPAPPGCTANPVYYWSYASPGSDPNNHVAMALAAAQELIGKLWRMEDTPPVSGLELTWTEYYFRPPLLNLGGYIEDPIYQASPGLPDYFYSPDNPPSTGDTIFDGLSYYNPQVYSATGNYGGGTRISWLRDADVLEYQRTWFRVTRRWLGAPVGAWDADIFSRGNRPSSPSNYRNLILG